MSRLPRAAAIAALISLGGGCGDSTAHLSHDASDDAADGAASDADAAPLDVDAADVAIETAPVVVGPPNSCAPGAAWFDLPYTVASAAYSRARGLLVLRPETEHAIYLLAPDTCGVARVTTPRLPMSIAVSPTETDVAVGQDGMVSFIDLASGAVRATVSIPAPASELAFDAQGRVLVFSHALASIPTRLLLVDPAGAGAGTVTAMGTLDGGGHLRGTADGAGLFWTADEQTTTDLAARIVVGRSPLLGTPVAAGPASCHDLFPADDGKKLVTACGTILGLSSADAALDLAPAGALAGVAHVQGFDALVAKGLAVVLPATDATTPAADGTVRLHTTSDFSFVGNLPLPILDSIAEQQMPHGRFVFLRADGARAYVVARRQPGQAPVDGVAVLDPAHAGPAPAPTIRISSSFPHRSGLPNAVTVPRVAATLAFRVMDAGYSRALGRLVMSSTKPMDAVYLVDPATGAAEALPAPVNPSAIAVRADGLVAAVTRDGGIRFLDLQKRTVLRDVDGPATSVAFGAGSEVLLAADASTSSWLNLDTGATRAASTTTGEVPGFSTVPGTSNFYSMRARGLARHDDTIAATDPSFDLAPFVTPESVVRPCTTPFWITDDGSHLVLDCSRVFALSPDPALDLRYLGFLETVNRLDDVAYAPSTHRFYSAPALFVLADGLKTAIGRITVHDDQLLDLVNVIDLGTFPGGNALSQPRRVFMGQTSKQLIVVVESDFFAPPTHAVYTLDVTGL